MRQVIALDRIQDEALYQRSRTGRILARKVEEFAKRVERGGIELVPVDADIWLRSLALEWDHSDPADRVIVATAISRNLPLLTNDRDIRQFGGVACRW